MSVQLHEACTRPGVPDSRTAVVVPCGDGRAVRGEGHGPHPLVVPREGSDAAPVGDVVHAQDLAGEGHQHRAPVRRQHRGVHGAAAPGVPLPDLRQELAGAGAPEADRAVAGPGEGQSLVAGDVDAAQVAAVPLELVPALHSHALGARRQGPEAGRAGSGAREEQPAAPGELDELRVGRVEQRDAATAGGVEEGDRAVAVAHDDEPAVWREQGPLQLVGVRARRCVLAGGLQLPDDQAGPRVPDAGDTVGAGAHQVSPVPREAAGSHRSGEPADFLARRHVPEPALAAAADGRDGQQHLPIGR
mmetsp:Transcript_1904/g.5597  ORF Transcript_1904/g.5597 Transcript_1904/m.5597 type:complete len:303 (+) Transcript_1904:443-1351(+)